MSAREQWQRTYRCARIAGLDLWSRERVLAMPHGAAALRVADRRLPLAVLAVGFASVAAKWLKGALK
jgi:hypothetical protein